LRSPRHFLPVALLFVVTLVPSVAAAETIPITSGFVEMAGLPSAYDLVGDRRGFRLFGQGYQGGVWPGIFVDCPDDTCGPGSVALFQHAQSGADLPSTVILDGVVYEGVGNLGGESESAGMGFSSSIVLPALASTAVLHSPFLMNGSFFSDASGLLLLRGTGVLTTTWSTAFGDGTEWGLRAARYDFAPAAVLEPGTLVLVGIGGVAAALRRRRQRVQ
jgi:hypothetical protein